MPLETLDFRTKNGVVRRSSPSEYPSIQRTYRLCGDPLGRLRSSAEMKIGNGREPQRPWGEYAGLEEDPAQPGSFWCHLEYHTTQWETWIGHFEFLNTCPNSDTIALSGPDVAYVGMTATYSYVRADPSSPFAILFSLGLSGSVQQGQCFNIGPGVTMGGTGVTSPSGAGRWTRPTIPPGLSGRTQRGAGQQRADPDLLLAGCLRNPLALSEPLPPRERAAISMGRSPPAARRATRSRPPPCASAC